MAPSGFDMNNVEIYSFNVQGIESGNSDNARINILPDLTVIMTFSLCYNKLDQFERTSALAEKANSSLTHFGRKDPVKFRFNFRGSCYQAQNKQRVSPFAVELLSSACEIIRNTGRRERRDTFIFFKMKFAATEIILIS